VNFLKSDPLNSSFQSFQTRRASGPPGNEDAGPLRALVFANTFDVKRKAGSLRATCQRAFTLTEMLVVMGVMTILTGLTVPAVRGLASSNGLDTGARRFADLLQVARSEAISQHTMVRFALATQWTGQDDAPLRKASLWSWDPETQQYFQTSSWETLPVGIVVETSIPGYVNNVSYAKTDASSIKGDCPLSPAFIQQNGFTSTATGATVTMQFVQFLPTGGAQVPGGALRNVIFVMTPGYANPDGTVTHTTQSTTQSNSPANWAQLNVDTLTGRVRVYQP